MQLAIPVLGMAKDDSHRTRALVNGRGEEYVLRGDPLLFQFCGAIQEEAPFRDRLSLQLRTAKTASAWYSIISRASVRSSGNALLSSFASVEEIKQADVETLMRGINYRKMRGRSGNIWLIAGLFYGKMFN